MRQNKKIVLFLYPFKKSKFFLEGGAIAPRAPPQLRHWLYFILLEFEFHDVPNSDDPSYYSLTSMRPIDLFQDSDTMFYNPGNPTKHLNLTLGSHKANQFFINFFVTIL